MRDFPKYTGIGAAVVANTAAPLVAGGYVGWVIGGTWNAAGWGGFAVFAFALVLTLLYVFGLLATAIYDDYTS